MDNKVKKLRIEIRKEASSKLETLREFEGITGYNNLKDDIEKCQQIIVDMDYLLSEVK